MTGFRNVMVNNRWPLAVPVESADTPGWPWWERERLAYMHAVIRPGDVVWDVGAERGYQAALYATWGARVVCVEPDKACRSVLGDVFAANAVSYFGLVGHAIGDGREEAWLTLDSVLDTFNDSPPQVVSIDIEGAEYRALLGGERLLTEVRPILFVSVHPEHIRADYNDTPDDVLCHLEKHRYDLHHLGYDHEHHWLCKPKP